MLSYEQQLLLVASGLAKVSVNGKLSTFKYSRKVMYDYLWNKHPELKYCRGHTYDNTNGELVLCPPTKSFNYLENDTWKDMPLDTEVILYKKFNGFMASLTNYEGEIVVGTTGTTSSSYANTAKDEIIKAYGADKIKAWGEGYTWVFEVCLNSDPHIVHETEGVKYLGGIDNKTGFFTPVGVPVNCTLQEAITLAKNNEDDEGYMMYTKDRSSMCKLKTDYYTGKKKLMRMSPSLVNTMYTHTKSVAGKLPAKWQFAVAEVINKHTKEHWLSLNDQERRLFLEEIYAKQK